MIEQEKEDFEKKHQTIFVLHPVIQPTKKTYDPHARLEEAKSLAEAISLKVIYADVVNVRKQRPATLFGSGLVETFGLMIKEYNPRLVLIDTNLSPVQQRNLEKIWNVKILDRPSLILEIFGARANTAEGTLQVELAALQYQKSRLVRTWTHLERQRGGLGFIGGPGESQLEIDRRLIAGRIQKLTEDLETVKRTRALHRKARQRVPYPIVALVGYTNAGKSTLFNQLTKANVFAEDLLFATLDPTLRRIQLPSKREIILSDTVGFISDLPTQLIAAFRATLEEVLEADLIVHVRDISHAQTDQQKNDVMKVLKELGLSTVLESGNMIEVLNKVDLLDNPDSSKGLFLSALSGQGVDTLLRDIENKLSMEDTEITTMVPFEEGEKLAWFYEKGHVICRHETDEGIELTVKLRKKYLNQLT